MKWLKPFDFKLFGTLILFGLLPTIYTTVRIHWLGELPSDAGFNIASQLAWLSILYEIVQEALLAPLYFMLGAARTDAANFTNRLRSGLLVATGCYVLLAIVIATFPNELLHVMSQHPDLMATSASYIRWEAIVGILQAPVQFLIIALVVLKENKAILIVLVVQMVLTISADLVLLSSFSFSFQTGVIGIPLSNGLVHVLLLVFLVGYFQRKGHRLWSRIPLTFAWMRQWWVVGGYAGLESLIRNAVYLLMILKMMNLMGKQGHYWVFNQFMWGWLLLPVLQLGLVIRRDAGVVGISMVKTHLKSYFRLTGLILLGWLITFPFWEGFIRTALNVSDTEKVIRIAITLAPFNALFALNHVLDSLFYGLGKTQYMLYQTLLVNILYYGGFFIAFQQGYFYPSLSSILYLFGVGLVLDALVTWWLFRRMVKVSIPRKH